MTPRTPSRPDRRQDAAGDAQLPKRLPVRLSAADQDQVFDAGIRRRREADFVRSGQKFVVRRKRRSAGRIRHQGREWNNGVREGTHDAVVQPPGLIGVQPEASGCERFNFFRIQIEERQNVVRQVIEKTAGAGGCRRPVFLFCRIRFRLSGRTGSQENDGGGDRNDEERDDAFGPFTVSFHIDTLNSFFEFPPGRAQAEQRRGTGGVVVKGEHQPRVKGRCFRLSARIVEDLPVAFELHRELHAATQPVQKRVEPEYGGDDRNGEIPERIAPFQVNQLVPEQKSDFMIGEMNRLFRQENPSGAEARRHRQQAASGKQPDAPGLYSACPAIFFEQGTQSRVLDLRLAADAPPPEQKLPEPAACQNQERQYVSRRYRIGRTGTGGMAGKGRESLLAGCRRWLIPGGIGNPELFSGLSRHELGQRRRNRRIRFPVWPRSLHRGGNRESETAPRCQHQQQQKHIRGTLLPRQPEPDRQYGVKQFQQREEQCAAQKRKQEVSGQRLHFFSASAMSFFRVSKSSSESFRFSTKKEIISAGAPPKKRDRKLSLSCSVYSSRPMSGRQKLTRPR